MRLWHRGRSLEPSNEQRVAGHPLKTRACTSTVRSAPARSGAQPKLEVIAGDALMVEVGARTPLGLNARVLPCGRPGLVFLDEVAYGGGDVAGPGDVVPAYVVQERGEEERSRLDELGQ